MITSLSVQAKTKPLVRKPAHKMTGYPRWLAALIFIIPDVAFASSDHANTIDLTGHTVGYISLAVFIIAYLFVIAEEFIKLPKSKPVLLAAGFIWVTIAIVYAQQGRSEIVNEAIKHNLLEYSELFLFLLVAMTYINAMEERLVFESLRSRLIHAGFGFRKLFWLTGALAFFISPVADNLTTALLMCAVVLSVGKNNQKFILLSCINIAVAANAGGAFSPFGDITTLMVWQKGIVDFQSFFLLFIPSLLNWLVPAIFMHFAVPDHMPEASGEIVITKRGAKRVIALFLLTIATAVSFHQFLQLPPVTGMMVGLGYLGIVGYYLQRTFSKSKAIERRHLAKKPNVGDIVAFDTFRNIARCEWDTLLFFYGVILCVGGLGLIGYLSMVSELLYLDLGPTPANILVGIMSAVVDNIPIMFAVLTMMPDMAPGQWLLVTLTAGVGGSLLSIGSAAGVALMGQAKGHYTFFGHLRWAPVIALGYGVSIGAHLLLNRAMF